MSENTQNITQAANRSSRPRVIPHTAPSGQEIPVIVRPMSNGESANNVDILDMSAQSEPQYLTLEDMKEHIRREKELDSLNIWDVTMEIMSKRIEPGGIRYQKVDGKKTDNPVLNTITGEPLRYDDKYYATVTFKGGSETFQFPKDFYDAFEVGERYRVKAFYGVVQNFGNSQMGFVFTSFEYR